MAKEEQGELKLKEKGCVDWVDISNVLLGGFHLSAGPVELQVFVTRTRFGLKIWACSTSHYNTPVSSALS